ncbi:MAG: fumarylacetoacetate hydrolase family protein [Candidatus Thermoplasmatota archaeon]
MKLATLRLDRPTTESERRDGRLALVDDVAGRVLPVPAAVAPNLLAALREWAVAEPRLRALDKELKAGRAQGSVPLAGCRFMAPLPRSTCWLDGSAYINHIILVRKARGAEPPADLRTVPLLYQGASDPMLGPNDAIEADEAWGPDLEAEVGVILDDVPRGTKAKDALAHVRLIVAMNDVSLRELIPRELAAGFGFFHGKPPTAFAPFAVTPDELGAAWKDGRVHLPMVSHVNGKPFGHPDAGPEMFFSFAQLVEHAAKTRPLPAGTVLGSGTVSNEDASKGFSCIAEVRMLETIQHGKPSTPYLRHGDTVRIEVLQDGRSVFGAIEQKVVPLAAAGGTGSVGTPR